MFRRWHAAHPDWRVIEHADAAFHQFMAQYMDKAPEGALGGSAFATLRVTVDWTNGRATFEQ